MYKSKKAIGVLFLLSSLTVGNIQAYGMFDLVKEGKQIINRTVDSLNKMYMPYMSWTANLDYYDRPSMTAGSVYAQNGAVYTKHINTPCAVLAAGSALYGLSQLKSAWDAYNEYAGAEEENKDNHKWNAINCGTKGLISLAASGLVLLKASQLTSFSLMPGAWRLGIGTMDI